MAVSEPKAREAYLNWLREEVEKHCNSDGVYEVYWNYDDEITPEQVINALEFSVEGYGSPWEYLEESVYHQCGFDIDDPFVVYDLKQDIRLEDPEIQAEFDLSDIWDDLEEAGYHGLDLQLDDLLRQSDFRMNIFFGTKAEQNLDMSSIVDAFGNDYRQPEVECVDAETLDNALSYLINQQGYSVGDVYDELIFGDEGESKFISSVCWEINELSAEAMGELAVLVRMDGRQALDFIAALDRNKEVSLDSIVFPKDSVTIGIYNEWSGCGGMFEIEPERDVVLPVSMVRDFQIEGQPKEAGNWTVDQVYGLIGECWKSGFEIRNDVADNVKEDYSQAIEKVQAKAERREVEAMIQENREARQSLDAIKNSACKENSFATGTQSHDMADKATDFGIEYER